MERRIELGMVRVELGGELVLPFSRCKGKDHISIDGVGLGVE